MHALDLRYARIHFLYSSKCLTCMQLPAPTITLRRVCEKLTASRLPITIAEVQQRLRGMWLCVPGYQSQWFRLVSGPSRGCGLHVLSHLYA